MGIKGFKVDFMNRDDQRMVGFYYRAARQAAAHHLMLDFHGAYKPTGLQRTYPNVMNFEGVRGMENEKWSNDDFPGYDVSIPFIRMLAGPLDYTPGAMRNYNKDQFQSPFSVSRKARVRVVISWRCISSMRRRSACYPITRPIISGSRKVCGLSPGCPRSLMKRGHWMAQ